jgi:hypothetical protein
MAIVFELNPLETESVFDEKMFFRLIHHWRGLPADEQSDERGADELSSDS